MPNSWSRQKLSQKSSKKWLFCQKRSGRIASSRLEMIDEALKYQAEGKYEVVVKIMMDLHRKFNQPPESQNEIYFYQKYGMLIREAESYLLQYSKYQDPLAMVQACDIYIQLLRDIEEVMKGAEIVARS
jgi:hypothetical protein